MGELQDAYSEDIERYDFQGVTDDVMSIISVPTAVLTTLKWAVVVPGVVGFLTAGVFAGRMPSWVLVPFVIGAVILSMLGAVAIGVLVVARGRLEETTGATGRILETVSQMHHDLVAMRGAEVSHAAVEDVALSFITSGAMETAAVASLPVPLQFVAKPVAKAAMWGPRKILERSTTALIDQMPWDQLDAKTREITDNAGALVDVVEDIDGGYANVQSRIEGTVQTVIAKTTRPLQGVVIALMTPLGLYLLIGFATS